MDIQFRNIISLKTAKLAKEKGFDIAVPVYYDRLSGIEDNDGYRNHNEEDLHHSAPTQAVLQTWLREKHNILAIVFPHTSDDFQIHEDDIIYETLWSYAIWNAFEFDKDEVNYSSYEEALEDALRDALNLIK